MWRFAVLVVSLSMLVAGAPQDIANAGATADVAADGATVDAAAPAAAVGASAVASDAVGGVGVGVAARTGASDGGAGVGVGVGAGVGVAAGAGGASAGAVAHAGPAVAQAPVPQTYNAGNQQPVQELARSAIVNADGSFNYSYDLSNGIHVEESGYVKRDPAVASRLLDAATSELTEDTGEINVAEGAFSYTAPDGTLISLRYIADENGFQPQGDHLPTPHPAIQRALAAIAAGEIDDNDDGSYRGSGHVQVQPFGGLTGRSAGGVSSIAAQGPSISASTSAPASPAAPAAADIAASAAPAAEVSAAVAPAADVPAAAAAASPSADASVDAPTNAGAAGGAAAEVSASSAGPAPDIAALDAEGSPAK